MTNGAIVSTKAEVTKRVFEVYKMLLAGLRREEIIRVGNEKYGWDVTARQVDKYIQRATQRLEEEATVKREAELGKAIGRLHSLYQKALTGGDHRGALAVQKELHDLLGLKAPAKHEFGGTDGGPIKHAFDFSTLSDDELDAAILRVAAGIAGGEAVAHEPLGAPPADHQAGDVP